MFSRIIFFVHYVKSRNASFIFTLLFLFSFIYIRLPHISSFIQNNTLRTSVRFISETSSLLEKALPMTSNDPTMSTMMETIHQCNDVWSASFPYTPSVAAPSALVKSYCFAQTFRVYKGSAVQLISPLIARAILDTDSTPLFQHWDRKKLMNLALFSTKNEILWMTNSLKREMHLEWKTITRLMEDLMDDCFFYTEQIILETHILVDLLWDIVSFVLLVLHFYSYFLYTNHHETPNDEQK